MKCRKCGKRIYGPVEQWGYSYREDKRSGYKRLHFCCYSCMESYRRDRLEKYRKTVKAVTKKREMAEEKAYLLVEDGEAHTLEEWADLYGIDYYEFADALTSYNGITLLDALYLAVQKKRESEVDTKCMRMIRTHRGSTSTKRPKTANAMRS